MENKSGPEFWDVNDINCEQLIYGDPDEALSDYLNGCHELPETVELVGYARNNLSDVQIKHLEGYPLERVLEILDDEFGKPDEATIPTDNMEKAEMEFIKVVVAEYPVWACREISREVIDVKKWCVENEPDLLKEEDNGSAG